MKTNILVNFLKAIFQGIPIILEYHVIDETSYSLDVYLTCM